MHKSAQLRDITTQWLEKGKNCAPDAQMSSNLTTPAVHHRQFIGSSGGGGRTTTIAASSSSMVTVTRLTNPINHHAAGRSSAAAAAKNKRNGMKPHRRLPPPLYVKLAEELTPTFGENCDSDTSSMYDSFNEVETDTAKDESDYSDGYVTDGFATMDVFEYEVDDLSDSEDLESHGSSSGTDDMVEVVAHALFDSTSSSSDSDDFEIFAQDADTEESDCATDPELGRADYWTCIKCKNQKNNPMYRFCEKCYQIRKTHFPPRPKHRKKRSSLAQRGNNKLAFSSPSTSSTISMQDEKRDRHLDDDDDDDGINGRISRNSSCDGSDNIGNQFLCNKLQQKQQLQQQRRRSMSSSYKHQQQKTHSAGESSCCSSQELSTDEQPPSTLSSKSAVTAAYLNSAAGASSQETYCSEIEHIDHQHHLHSGVVISSKQSNPLFEHNYPNSQDSVYPNSECTLSKFDSLVSTASACSVSGSSQSSNECESNGTSTSGVYSQTQTSGNDSDGMSMPKASKSCDNNVTTTTSESMKSMSTVEKTPSSSAMAVATINRSASESCVSSSKKLKKRKIDFTDEISDAEINDDELMAKKFRALDEVDTSNGMCMICLSEPKNGAFVHNRFLHVCCCYRCTVKVWNKRKRCPICNSQVKTVLKMFVH